MHTLHTTTFLAVNYLTLTGVNGLLHLVVIPHVALKTPLSFDPCVIQSGPFKVRPQQIQVRVALRSSQDLVS